MTDEEQKAAADKAAADKAAAEAAAAGAKQEEVKGEEKKPTTPEEWAVYTQKLEEKHAADKAALNKALHNERKNKGGAAAPDMETLAKNLEEVKAELEQKNRLGLASKFTHDEAEQTLALQIFDKLALGVTDPAEREKLMARSAFLARTEKNANGNDAVQQIAATMHGGSRGTGTTNDGVTPSAVEIGKHFGNTAEALKNANRTPKNLYG